MCGYCSEELALEIMRHERDGLTHESVAAAWPLALVMRAQETAEIADLGPVPPLIDLCRRIEAAVGGRAELPPVLPSGDAIIGGWRVPTHPTDADAFDAATVAHRFATWWPDQNPDADGPDPWGWSDAKSRVNERMEAMFAEVWAATSVAFALLPLTLCAELARRIVLMASPFVPQPEGLDLWLQRRAVIALRRSSDLTVDWHAPTPGVRPVLLEYLALLPHTDAA